MPYKMDQPMEARTNEILTIMFKGKAIEEFDYDGIKFDLDQFMQEMVDKKIELKADLKKLVREVQGKSKDEKQLLDTTYHDIMYNLADYSQSLQLLRLVRDLSRDYQRYLNKEISFFAGILKTFATNRRNLFQNIDELIKQLKTQKLAADRRNTREAQYIGKYITSLQSLKKFERLTQQETKTELEEFAEKLQGMDESAIDNEIEEMIEKTKKTKYSK